MKSAIWKDTLREIKKSMGRFCSIMAISAIGVAFFAGVKASAPDMEYTADAYFDEFHLRDIQVISTMGLTKDDAAAIRDIDGVEGVSATHSLDVLAQYNTQQLVLKIHALPDQKTRDEKTNYINQADLISGRMPEKSGECLVEAAQLNKDYYKIGDTITVTSGNDQEISKSLKTNTFTVVGTTHSPDYLSYELGSASIGSGKVDNYIMILDEDFNMDYYTAVNITVAGARPINSYDEDAYFAVTDPVKAALENIAEERTAIRFAQIKKEANEEYDKGVREYEDGKKKFDDGIQAAQDQLILSENTLIDSASELEAAKQDSEKQIADAQQKLAEGRTQASKLQEQYDSAKPKADAAMPQMKEQLTLLQNNIAALKQQIQSLESGISALEEQLKNPALDDQTRKQLEEQKHTLQTQKTQADTALKDLTGKKDILNSQIKDTADQLQQLKTGIAQLNAELDQKDAQLTAAKESADQQFQAAQQQIDDGYVKLEDGKKELEKQRTEGQKELDTAKEKLTKAKQELDELKQPEWYVLDRHSHYSYMDYGSVAERMDGISKVFPVFFFIVAALVCLTTMTRMVDEQRGTIGTLKALGYSKTSIAMKYVCYALIASLVGSVIGCAVGMVIFPQVIFNAWALMYTLPELKLVFQPVLAAGSAFMVIGITIAASLGAVYKELMEVPSALMRPKPPKDGKKILLERIPFLWKHFSFIHKVTARNIFRYKKRFFMTVIGISGCTALLVAGFGIQDSISDVVSKQYGEIYQYDMSLSFQTDAAPSQKKKVMDKLDEDERITSYFSAASIAGTIDNHNDDISVSLIIPSDPASFKDYVSLRTRWSHTQLELDNKGCMITEKLSKNLGIEKGDSLMIDNGTGDKQSVVIEGITENYIGHMVYMSAEYYKHVFQEEAEDNTVYAKLKEPGGTGEQQIGEDLMKDESVSAVSFYSGVAQSFQDTISSLSFVVVVLIIAAGMLAFVVLYNLTNVNISERIREIATIKVLGFYDKEVSAYVYRENLVLTMIGAAAGLLLGIGLHYMIMGLAEMDNVMFGRNIDSLSFLLSFIITMLFAVIVNLVMYGKLKHVPMVESLKSVE